MEERIHLFGIRHHGPGSAASLLAALDALQPVTILIEGPPEADSLIPFAAAPGMRPPLALLAYAADDPASSIFYPFAVFSPEWQAMRWASRHERPVRFIDWPAAMALASRTGTEPGGAPKNAAAPEPSTGPREGELAGEDGSAGVSPDAVAAELPVDRDPLDRLAEASGHPDGEALWNALVESRGASSGVFAAIEAAITTLRSEMGEVASGSAAMLREARREAHMRLEIGKALKEHDGTIAVVVGAWHVPALRRKVPASQDRTTLKDAPKTKVEITWVPWTETRLATASGYGAGVTSPGWYAHLWELYEGNSSRIAAEVFAAGWQSKVAMLLRAEGHPAATASIIEATRLALALAAVRGHAVPGLDEMRDATLAALCRGDVTPFRLIEGRLIVGEAIGALDDSVPQMPLAADLARWQRRLRLKPEPVEQEIALDLRSEAGFAKSVLLHRLDLMDVSWGRMVDAGLGRGTFREIWRLAWVPELSVKLAEALVYGVTIEQAAAGAAMAQIMATPEIAKLAELVRRCLFADLSEAAELSIARLQAAAVNAVEVASLMRAVPALVSILRYGTARRMPLDALSALAKALVVEVNAGIGFACGHLDDAAAEEMRQAVIGFDAALVLLGDEHLSEEWNRRLRALVDNPSVVQLVAGLALRRLYDRAILDAESVAGIFSRSLSRTLPSKAIGQWLDGFLGSDAEVILHDPTLFDLIDGWIGAQQEADFVEILPMLRRAFGGFGATERRRLLMKVDQGHPAKGATLLAPGVSDYSGFEKALPLLFKLLGLEKMPGPQRHE